MSNSIGLHSSILGIIEDVNISQIKYSGSTLRANASSIVGLTESIQVNGLLQPIIVRPKENYFEIVAGNRRCKACRDAKVEKDYLPYSRAR